MQLCKLQMDVAQIHTKSEQRRMGEKGKRGGEKVKAISADG